MILNIPLWVIMVLIADFAILIALALYSTIKLFEYKSIHVTEQETLAEKRP